MDWRVFARGGIPADLSGARLRSSLRIALVVGSLLNLVNQGRALLFDWHQVQPGKLVLNYVVPFLVATYSVWSSGRPQRRP